MKPIFNALEFDGINSMQHSIFITGESVYDAPERDVESVEIAGRSGNVLIDNGRWKNLEVTYHAGTFGSDQDEFASKIRNFRNLLASRYGYHRLMDTYNPEEYRIGRFKSVEVEAEGRKRAGEFDITFDCKPQRYLTSGESSISVSSGDTLYNPTPYDASPLLAVEGYGTMGFNGYEIELSEGLYGQLEIAKEQSLPVSATADLSLFNNGDEITILPFSLTWYWSMTSTMPNYNFFSTPSVTMESGEGVTSYVSGSGSRNIYFKTTFDSITFNSNADYSDSTTATITVLIDNNATPPYFKYDLSAEITVSIEYESATGTFSISESYTRTGTGSASSFVCVNPAWKGAVVNSTKSYLSGTTYIDCDLGDAYKIENGSYISLNSYIDLGSDLPTLASGANEITYDNTITDLKITPRWWIL